MSLDMLLQILRALERLLTEVALVWLEGNMNTNVRGDVIALDSRGVALIPSTGEVEIVGAFAANMTLTHMVLKSMLATTIYGKLKRAWKNCAGS